MKKTTQNTSITVLKSILYDKEIITSSNGKTAISKLIYMYLFNIRLANNRKLPSLLKISRSLNVDVRTIEPNLKILVESGLITINIESKTFEIFFIQERTKDLILLDTPEYFSAEYNRSYDFYRLECGYYVSAPQEIFFSKELSANEKIYYLIFKDYFMNGRTGKQYQEICHLSKLIQDKNFPSSTIYDNFSSLRSKGFITCDTFRYGKKANDVGFKNLCFHLKPIKKEKTQTIQCKDVDFTHEFQFHEEIPEDLDELLEFI